MKRPRIFWLIFSSYLLIVILSLSAVSFYASRNMKEFYLNSVSEGLKSRAELLKPYISKTNILNKDALIESVNELGEQSRTRITVILPDGTVVADSEEDPLDMDNHKNRPEIRDAMQSDYGEMTRHSGTLNQNMKYVALPVIEDGEITAIIRTAIPISDIDETLGTILMRIYLTGALILILAAGVGYWGSKAVTKPLEQLKESAIKYAGGEFDGRIAVESTEEITSLAETMNHMAAEINRKLEEITREKNEKEAMLSSMVEGVLAIDLDRRIFQMNRAATGLLDTDASRIKGKFIHEVIRNPELQKFVDDVIETEETLETDILLRGKMDKYLQVLGTNLDDSDGNQIGILIVLNDITRLKNLEKIRREFVANVSHELKTPITSIKGFVETLLDGAGDDPAESKRFLEIVVKQTNRLNTIIEDLLSLSRIERETEREEIELTKVDICTVLKSAIDSLELEASSKSININLDCKKDLSAEINPQLLEQAVVNLLTNAIKYSDDGSNINVSAVTSDDSQNILISVQDFGCGIDENHLSRLFERFYRVDKARSRELGGTGLGLAIVKHIAHAHKGRVSVESEKGKGSIFTLIIPLPLEI